MLIYCAEYADGSVPTTAEIADVHLIYCFDENMAETTFEFCGEI